MDIKKTELKKDILRIIPHGGLGEVGRNMTSFEINKKILIVDIGVLFAGLDEPGADLVLPDFSYLKKKINNIEAIFLTHAHEDHIGALPYFLRLKQDILLIGSLLTLEIAKSKLKEFKINPKTKVVSSGEKFKLKEFELSFYSVTHSIPDCLAVSIKTKAGTVLHTGDIKVDMTPVDNRPCDFQGLAALGAKGVDLALLDSTNSLVRGFCPSETSIYSDLENILSNARRQIFVCMFSSHIHRAQQIINIAAKLNKKVCFLGRSIKNNFLIAKKFGYLSADDAMLISEKEAAKIPKDRIVYICTGSQGENLAVLYRISCGTHPIEAKKGDTVLLASSVVPGNEKNIYSMIENFIEKGVNVFNKDNANVHVSGHGYSGDIQQFYSIIKPSYAMPVHGEYRHLSANGALAVETGLKAENIIYAKNGFCIDLKKGEPYIADKIPNSKYYLAGKNIINISKQEFQKRYNIAHSGIVSVFVLYSASEKSIKDIGIKSYFTSIDKESFDKIKDDLLLFLNDYFADKDFSKDLNIASAEKDIRKTVEKLLSKNKTGAFVVAVLSVI